MSLDVAGLQFQYDGRPLLDGVGLHVPAGASGFLLGPSGVGKTTVLRCIAGLETPDGGGIQLDGVSLVGAPVHKRRIGLLFQEPALFPHLDVAGNVGFGVKDRANRADTVCHWLDVVGLADRSADRVDELSGGQRQRVALARTLAAEPRAVLLDEPFSALDRTLRDELGNRVKELLSKAGVPALWVTHDEAEAERLGDHIWELSGGRAQTKR